MHVVVVGGGVAGLAAATSLADHGCRVTLLEARPRLGGRASSFTDSASGLVLDTCQHVSMGCCTNFAHLCRTLGVDHFLEPQPALFFMTPDGRITRWETARWPAPLHQLPAFISAHFLTLREKIRVGRALAALWRDDRRDDPPFAEWLAEHGQTPELIRRFWDVVLVSALNEATKNVGFRYARQVFVEAFLKDRRGGVVQVPSVPLVKFYSEKVPEYLTARGSTVRLNAAVESVQFDQGRAVGVRLRTGETLQADACLLAVPFDRIPSLLPGDLVEQEPALRNLRCLHTSPITSVHLWYDRPVLPNEPGRRGIPRPLPHVVLIGGISQWVFNRGKTGPEEYYLQVVISASASVNGQRERSSGLSVSEAVLDLVRDEIVRLFPACKTARLKRSRVIVEKSATFSVRPGVDELRPRQKTGLPGLYLAGDWTRTGWPATMEGAVRSGYLAAEAILQSEGRSIRLLHPDLDGIVRYP